MLKSLKLLFISTMFTVYKMRYETNIVFSLHIYFTYGDGTKIQQEKNIFIFTIAFLDLDIIILLDFFSRFLAYNDFV